MKDIKNELSSEVKLNTLARSIYNESKEMGFKSQDYVKLMNELIDMTINNVNGSKNTKKYSDAPQLYKIDLPIMTTNLIIRKYEKQHDEKYVSKWFNDDNNRLFFLSTTSKPNLDVDALSSDGKNIFATISLKNDKPIGLLALLNIDRENSKGEMRKMIGDITQRGKGFAKEASEVWLRYCTEIIGLNKVYITTIETNVKNISLNRQIGFRIEGLLKKECVIDKIEHDVLRMAYFKR
jgi:RimJ/RimL family protein N-acetyltransferase